LTVKTQRVLTHWHWELSWLEISPAAVLHGVHMEAPRAEMVFTAHLLHEDWPEEALK
jgi:hypothetical protein